MDPDRSFATPEDAQRLFTDHDSFIGAPYDAYAVTETVRKGPERLAPSNAVSPGHKIVVAVTDEGALGRLATFVERDAVARYVENRVVTAVMTGAFTPASGFVELHVPGDDDLAPEIAKLVGTDGQVHAVSEYVKK
jgi:hypothetical protein